jgi:hypothetical protein
MRRGSVLDSSYYLLENFAGIVFGQLAAADDEIKKLAIRAISGGADCINVALIGSRRQREENMKSWHNSLHNEVNLAGGGYYFVEMDDVWVRKHPKN